MKRLYCVGALLCLLIAVSVPGTQRVQGQGGSDESIDNLVKQLGSNNPATNDIMKKLIAKGRSAVPSLIVCAMKKSHPVESRGRALVCLQAIGDKSALPLAKSISADPAEDTLVRLWALGLLGSIEPNATVDTIFEMMTSGTSGNMYNMLSGKIVDMGPAVGEALVKKVLHGQNNAIRRLAAGYLGAAQINTEENRQAYIKAIAYDADMSNRNAATWNGGALFVPGVAWSRPEARDLLYELLQWWLWGEDGHNGELNQVRNNVRGVGFFSYAGLNRQQHWNNDGTAWALTWTDLFAIDSNEPVGDSKLVRKAGSLLLHAWENKPDDRTEEIIQRLYTLSGKKFGGHIEKWKGWLAYGIR